MSPEVVPPANKEPTFHTPESFQECFVLAGIIDSQVARWRSFSRHPILHTANFSHLITVDSTPLGREPIDYLPFADPNDPVEVEDAQIRTNYERRRSILTQWITYDEIDELPIRTEQLADHVSVIRIFASSYPEKTDFQTATKTLMRLAILREQLAIKMEELEELNINDFETVFKRLWADLT